MKKLNLLIISFLIFFSKFISAQEVSFQEAHEAVQNYLTSRILQQAKILTKTVSFQIKSLSKLKDPKSNELLAHIVHLSPGGFIILSPDKNMKPVIAYTLRYNWNSDTSQVNILYHLLQQDMKLRKEAIKILPPEIVEENHLRWQKILTHGFDENLFYVFQQWPEQGTTSTGGWVETTWHQGSPYNDFCPIDPGTHQRCVVGCVATAMSQIVNHYKILGNFYLDASYQYTTGDLHIHFDHDSSRLDFPSFERLNQYLSDVEIKYQSQLPLNETDCAALSLACGILVEMNYSSSGSGASTSWVGDKLEDELGYDSAEWYNPLNTTPMGGLNSEGSFFYLLKHDMMNGLPAQMAIKKQGSSGGHSIICDGYNTDNFYHLNFGWGLNSPDPIMSAWYSLPHHMPSNYNVIKGAVMKIQPDSSDNQILSVSPLICEFSPSQIAKASESKEFSIYNSSHSPVEINTIYTPRGFKISTDNTIFSDTLETLIVPPNKEISIFAQSIPENVGFYEGESIIYSGTSPRYLSIMFTGYGWPADGTIVNSGGVSGIWDQNGSPYYILGDIRIYSGDCLEVRPGVDVQFLMPGSIRTDPNARLMAVGNESDSIFFGIHESNTHWFGFDLRSNDNQISYCIIQEGNANSENKVNGGAVFVSSGSLTLTNSRIENNKASGYGGGICILDGSLSLFNTVVVNNSSESGGALFSRQSQVEIVNSTICCNNAEDKGSAIYCEDTVQVKNSILWDNGYDEPYYSQSGRISFNYCNIDTSSIIRDGRSMLVKYPISNSNISEDPLFVNAEEGIYYLKDDSPCVDRGDPDPAFNDPEDPNYPGYAFWPSRGTIRNDMGAYGGSGYLQTKVKEEIELFPDQFILEQNFPNPFNSTTSIHFYLPQSARVMITIFNLKGTEIKRYVQGLLSAGSHLVQWNGKAESGNRVASGMYFYKIEAKTKGEPFVDVKKMIFMK